MTGIVDLGANGLTRRRFLMLGAGAVVATAAGFEVYRAVLYRHTFGGETASPGEAHASATAGEIVLIDIRRPDEWEATGIPEGAQPLDMRREDFVPALEALLGGDRSAPVALICARGVRSDRTSKRLAEAGFTRIVDVPEGMLGSPSGPGWLKRGLPVVTP